MCHATEWWTDSLPAVLLGIRSAWKEDIQATPAEVLYGQTLRLPGDFLAPASQAPPHDPLSFTSQLRDHMRRITPQPGSRHGDHPVFVFKDLRTTSHVFVRNDAVRGSLQPPYEGPFAVVSRLPKDFVVNIRGRNAVISLNRLKPAYMPTGDEPQTAGHHCPEGSGAAEQQQQIPVPFSPGYTTKAGRRVRFPHHLKDFDA
ncbi:uncharacterized protein [Hetaerina americana]|uniref:uncharacterized protein n=1 Tax=Hetaerina americana TaxID=62018 RepID=UPI003A7F37CC